MSTRAALFTQNPDGTWMMTYSHYDGYPSHMLPALAKADPDAIRAAGEIRQIRDDGTVEPFAQPRPATRLDTPRFPDWASHAYVLTNTAGWQHATARELPEISQH